MLWIDSLRQASARLRITCFWAGFWLARPRLLWRRLADARQLYRSRCELAELDDRLCQDLGITRLEAGREAGVAHPGELSPWAPLELRMAVAESRWRHAPRPWLRAVGRPRPRG